MMKYLILLKCLFILNTLSGQLWIKDYNPEAFIGPEIYHVQRTKEGGSKQSGTLYGVRLGFDDICRCKFYYGVDVLWARGILSGKTEENRLKSELTDCNVEARIGYFFQKKNWCCFSITPFVGGGCFWENNLYQSPSPLHIHFKNRFYYLPFGFLSQILLAPEWGIGFNVKLRYLFNSKIFVTNDPEHGNSTQLYDEHLQYRYELPLTYFRCWKGHSLAASFIPFYECRPYGYRPNFPFDFLETKFQLYGITLKVLYLF